MSSERTAALRQLLVQAQGELLAVLNRVGPDQWSSPSPNEGWTIRDLLVHLTSSETAFVRTLRRMAAGQGGVPADFDPNRWNAGQLRRRAEQTPEQLRAELERAFDEMLAELDALDHAALDQRGYLSTGVEGNTEDNFRLVASHKRAHTDDIRTALANPARVKQG
jgi:uncharacterized protein (TIGR03083 family)